MGQLKQEQKQSDTESTEGHHHRRRNHDHDHDNGGASETGCSGSDGFHYTLMEKELMKRKKALQVLLALVE
jgi:hypothetical protein